MIIAVCDPKGIAIEAIKTILYHDKGLSDRISRIYEFWNPYNSNSGSTEGRRVTILEAMQTSHVTLGVDRIRIPN